MEAENDYRKWKELLGEAMEKAPEGFTDKVMAQLQPETAQVTQTRIPWWKQHRTWVLVLLAGLTFANLFMPGSSEGRHLLLEGAFGRLREWNAPDFSLPDVPDSAAWGALALLVFALFQFVWLQRYHAHKGLR
ncbi:hypothetical protein [Robiginitalea sediminis]|uniref:hypothetical protein n=1 Tax=Robiginitalea sediminis TaxID=1982593 RepID=UPI000B4B1FC5|nr:hypothetical protein [Robiginitalea sediminis]